jgi:predicted kinase
MPTKKVIIPRGLPGSGKSTWVKEQLATHPAGTAVRLNNDDLSMMLYNEMWGNMFNNTSKELLHHLRLAMLKTFLAQEYITHIYVDNTNLARATVKALQDVTLLAGAEFVVVDTFLDVPIEECIERDSKREKVVGGDIIRKMAGQLKGIKPWVVPETPSIKPYPNKFHENMESVVLCDIDGTIALMNGRGPYEFDKVHTDLPNFPVAGLVNSLYSIGTKVIFMSGRGEESRSETAAWLWNELGFESELYMRAAGDMRPDWIVKYELFQEHIAGKYHVWFVLDDRDQVVDLWRRKLGLPTFQVADGDF